MPPRVPSPGGRAPLALAFSEMLPLVAGTGRAGSVPRSPQTCGPSNGAEPTRRWRRRLSAGWSWKGFGWGTALNVPQAARYEAGSAVCGKNGRTDGEVLSHGAASLCRDSGEGCHKFVGKRYEEL